MRKVAASRQGFPFFDGWPRLPNMPALIHPIGSLKAYIGGQAEVTVEAGRTVRETLAALGIPSEVVAGVLLNDVLQSKDYRVQDGDTLKLIAVIGGGAPAGHETWAGEA